MSDYGLKVWDASGNVTLDTTDSITRLRYSNEVAADASSSVTLSDISGLDSVEISVGLEDDFAKLPTMYPEAGQQLHGQHKAVHLTTRLTALYLFFYTRR